MVKRDCRFGAVPPVGARPGNDHQLFDDPSAVTEHEIGAVAEYEAQVFGNLRQGAAFTSVLVAGAVHVLVRAIVVYGNNLNCNRAGGGPVRDDLHRVGIVLVHKRPGRERIAQCGGEAQNDGAAWIAATRRAAGLPNMHPAFRFQQDVKLIHHQVFEVTIRCWI